ncbi:MAG TPA: hypothetical protein VM536_01760 [Chloroflexia bacterium]|nr:hypothetical protein [Chloroflexia bacterium]
MKGSQYTSGLFAALTSVNLIYSLVGGFEHGWDTSRMVYVLLRVALLAGIAFYYFRERQAGPGDGVSPGPPPTSEERSSGGVEHGEEAHPWVGGTPESSRYGNPRPRLKP